MAKRAREMAGYLDRLVAEAAGLWATVAPSYLSRHTEWISAG